MHVLCGFIGAVQCAQLRLLVTRLLQLGHQLPRHPHIQIVDAHAALRVDKTEFLGNLYRQQPYMCWYYSQSYSESSLL